MKKGKEGRKEGRPKGMREEETKEGIRERGEKERGGRPEDR